MKKILGYLLFLPLVLNAYETVVSSDEVRYNGEIITLIGNVTVENDMGKVTAKSATLKKDPEKKTKIDFPWIELQSQVTLKLEKGGTLYCDALFLDYTQMTSFFTGKPQVTYSDQLGEIYADRAQVDYREANGTLEATKVTLFDNVRLVNTGTPQKPALQYALADCVFYFPEEQVMLMEGKNSPVLFYDQQRDMQMSARTIRAQRDPETKKESVQGLGDVRFIFGAEELEKIKTRFQIK